MVCIKFLVKHLSPFMCTRANFDTFVTSKYSHKYRPFLRSIQTKTQLFSATTHGANHKINLIKQKERA